MILINLIYIKLTRRILTLTARAGPTGYAKEIRFLFRARCLAEV